ncbi:MAG: class I SAM-dependent methyltransferase [Actinomycetota bacterium]|uniref:class I SAM-dependent methyltransferase n=1 Tax=Euzebya pacifica TaxID=1608957 RepID=UPI0030F8AB57
MRMNRTETVLVNSPPRRWLQRAVETPVLLRLGGRMAGGTALELGCGQGAGIELILDRFGADRVIGFDLDEAMVARARRRLAGRSDVDVRVGDAVAIDLPDASVDAVFDFAIIHHVPDWQTAVGEIRRVLRPGGRLYYSEVTKHALDRPTYRMLFDHPDHDRFTASDFVAALEDHDLRVGDRHRTLIAGDYALGVAERMPHSPS